MITARGAERWVFAGVVVVMAVVVVWFGARLVERSLETRLIQDVLFEWQRLGQSYHAQGETWPLFEGSNHVAYMQALVERMQRLGLLSPQQSRQVDFSPRLKHFWREDERLFILLLPGRLVVFGLAAQTYARIDQQVDGVNDPARGSFTGRQAADKNQMIGYWQL